MNIKRKKKGDFECTPRSPKVKRTTGMDIPFTWNRPNHMSRRWVLITLIYLLKYSLTEVFTQKFKIKLN